MITPLLSIGDRVEILHSAQDEEDTNIIGVVERVCFVRGGIMYTVHWWDGGVMSGEEVWEDQLLMVEEGGRGRTPINIEMKNT